MGLSQPLGLPWLVVAVLGYTAYLFGLAIYRLYLSPISKFPGPKLAALTSWYEFYHDVIRHGKYTFEIADMHKKYGPIVRITPWELHVDEPDFYEVLYSRDSPRDKYKFYANMFGHPEAMIAALDHNRHRMLRANMNPYFSMRRIRSLEPDIQALVKKLVKRLNDFKGTGVPLTIQYPFTCYSTDTITSYTMGSGFQYLDSPDFAPDWSITLSSFAKMSAVLKPMPWIGKLMDSLPQGLVTKMNPGMALMFAWQARCHAIIKSVLDAYRKGELKREPDTRPTFFHDIVTSELPEREKTEERLAQELQIVVAAGAETVAKFLSWTTYFLLENPEKLEKLKEELDRLDPDRTATLVELENMPYLTSVMLEGLRLTYGVSTRLARIAPDRALQLNDWSIPPGTPISMTSVFMHHNEKIFPDSYNFVPERWMDLEKRKKLETYMVAFTKGSRQCIGMNLARAEMLLAMASIYRDVKFELYETTREDVTMAHELFLAFPKVTSKGVRMLIKE